MTKQPLTCKFCQSTIGANGAPFVWRQLAPKKFVLYETDGNGNATYRHPCHKLYSGTVNPAMPIDEIATAETRQAAIDLAATIDLATIYDELDQLDQERARLEPKHYQLDITYSAPELRSDGIRIPSLDRDYLIDKAHLEAIQAVIALADSTGIPQNIGLHGPAGSGKSTLGVQIGAIRQSPTFVIEAAAKQTADEWYGEATGIDRDTGAVTFRASRFIEAIETPNATVVINDVALLQSRTVQNGLNEILDPTTRSTFVEQLDREVRVARGVIIVGNWNVGVEYTGASELSLQLLSRFRAGSLFEVGFPSNGALVHILRKRTGINEPMATRLSNMTDWLRADSDPICPDTRGLIAAAHLIVKGRPLGHAIAFTVFGDLGIEERARAFGIIDVALGDSAANEAERAIWATPKSGEYVALGDVITVTEPIATDNGLSKPILEVVSAEVDG